MSSAVRLSPSARATPTSSAPDGSLVRKTIAYGANSASQVGAGTVIGQIDHDGLQQTVVRVQQQHTDGAAGACGLRDHQIQHAGRQLRVGQR